MSRRPHQTLVSIVMSLALVVQPLNAAAPQFAHSILAPTARPTLTEGPGYLFRVTVTADSPSRRARLDALEVVVLDVTADDRPTTVAGDDSAVGGPWSAVVLADADQLADLARLGFRPRAADELRLLVSRQGPEKRWLAESLASLLAQADAVAAQQTAAGIAGTATAPDAAAMITSLRAAMHALTPEQIAALTGSPSIDDDADGLTNTEEAWWCTDPLNPNSDGDAQGYTDGQEVRALLDFTLPRNVRWGYGPPFGPPNAWPNFNDRNGTHVNVCNDGDWDTIPDYAEAYMVGTRVPEESTDRDKFDDGQELFGITFCPGAPTNCGYGSYPAVEYWNFIQARVPDWVLPPGDNPLVAAFPVPEVYVTPGSWRVERVTTITTSEGQMTQTSHTYETSVTRGQSSSIADTVTWNNWEEVSQAIEMPIGSVSAAGGSPGSLAPDSPNVDWKKFIGGSVLMAGGGAATAALALGGIGATAGSAVVGTTALTLAAATCAVSVVCAIGVGAAAALAVGVGSVLIADGLKSDTPKDPVQAQVKANFYNTNTNINNVSTSASAQAMVALNQNFDMSGVINSLDGVQYALNQQGQLVANALYDVSHALSQPRYTETRTNGRSWGGSQTTTHEEYEEHTIAEGQAFTTGQNWSTAWAVDSSHAADLTFEFTVKNTGTEYARELTGIVINVYIGDDTSPSISYPAWQKFPGGKLENLFPVGPNTPPGQFSARTFTTDRIPLTLEQMKRIDLGERLTVKVESYSFGADELFYRNAVQGGVTVFIEDGVEDGDESVDSYVIPTWGVESVQDVLTRYFPAGYDAEGNLNALWTPEFDGVNPPTWREHYLSDIAWWNVYFTQADAGDTPLKDLPAQAGSAILFRFNRDSDRDGYNDRAEFRYYCSLPAGNPDHAYCADAHLRPEVHPQPEVAAGYVAERSGNVVTVKLAVANTGTFDAYGIDAVMYSPDDTTTIGNNTVGGNGRVRPGHQVAVGSLIKPPDLSNWGASTAKPYAGGQFTGAADRTFTFTAETAGVVGQGDTSVRWSDGAGGGGVILLGSSYHAPLPVDVAQGLQIGFNTGTIMPGARFTVQALTPRDTFTYTVNSEPFTPPVIVVSYSDPQGSHRFVTPVELPRLDASIPAGQMLEGLKLEVVTPAPFNPSGANTTHLVVNSPHPATIRGGHLYLNFVSDGKVVLEKAYTLDIPPGPTLFPAEWSATEFSADYHPDGDNLLIAFWTDSEGNIIDSAARPLSSFQADPQPASAIAEADEVWDFGTATQGTLLRRTIAMGSVGFMDLLTYVGSVPGLSISGQSSRRLPPGDVALYDLTLNTTDLPEGPFERTLAIRTSDPEHPARTITIRGTVTSMPPDSPGGAILRPLDWSATFASGTQGQWAEFTHTLGPQPQTLHPVKVWSQDYGRLWGVGKYATPFSAGTASYDMFGDGRDGVMPSSGNLDYNNGVGVGVVNSGSAGSYTINVTDVYAVWRINPGDVVLIHQTQGSGAGCWELNKAVSDFGGGTATYQLAQPLRCNYASGGNNHAQIQRVPQYTDCPVSGTVTPLAAWNGSWGGIFAVMCSGTMNLMGNVNSVGYGFRGGARGYPSTVYGGQGESLGNPGNYNYVANAGGGGGGKYDTGSCPSGGKCVGAGGGGGGYGTNGADGTSSGDAWRQPGLGGSTYGSADLSTALHLGSGGGGGGADDSPNAPGGLGGSGGGIILLSARILSGSGAIVAGGADGQTEPGTDDASRSGGGGGGSGGSIFLRSFSANTGNGLVTALGGNGAPGNSKKGAPYGGNGGNGGNGRIRIEYCESFSGSTNPPASVQKLNCYIAEQIESAPHDRGRLNLPETFSGGRTYQVQYGRRFVFGGAGEQTAVLRVSAAAFTNATLDALISEVGSGSVTFRLDVGNDGSWDWEWSGNVDNAATLNSPNLAAAFGRYWAANGAPTSGTVDVPVRIYLSKGGQVLLTNLQVTPTGSKVRYVRLGAGAQGSAPLQSATVSFIVNNDVPNPGPLTVAADVGDDGTVDWTWSGSPTYPARLTTGNLASAVNAYLSGRSGEVDVPIRFYVAPFLPLGLADFTTAPNARPDVNIGPEDVTFGGISAAAVHESATNTRITGGNSFIRASFVDGAAAPTADPTEGDTITINATIHNTGALDTGPLTAAFYATSAGGMPWYLGAAFVPNIPAGGIAQAAIPWNTLGFTGTVPVCVMVDPYNRVTETNEDNNQATANITIRTRPDLQVTGIALSDNEPMAGETVTVTLTLRNHGQTAAAAQTVALYQGNPDAGGTVVGAQGLASLPGGNTATVTFTWTPSAPGPYRLFARADRDNAVNEYDEGNNETWRDVYVGLASPVRLDSGGGDAYDPAYSPALGFGYLDGQANTFCGTDAGRSQRSDFDGTVRYRFDHLLPGHFYHLDLTLYECDGLGRQQRVRIDDNLISDVIDLSDGRPKRLSFRLDPAFYADRGIVVSIEELSGNDAVVSEINLYDVDYRYSDAGAATEPAYSPGRSYGWLDGVAQNLWGNLPYQTRRIDLGDSDPSDDPDNELRYRFDGLRSDRRYQLLITVYQGAGTATVRQAVAVDSVDTGVVLEVVGVARDDKVVDVPVGTYSDDGTITVRITRLNAAAGAFINEIALEELTLLPEQESQVTQSIAVHTGGPNWFSFNVKPLVRPAAACAGVTPTSAFTTLYGTALLGGAGVPVGTLVEAYTPAGVKVGCFKVTTAGLYGYMRVYGAEGTTPGMRPGEPIFFKINGIAATPTPYPVIWQDDKGTHEVNLAAPDVIPVETLLAPVAGQYSKLQCETGTYLPLPADPRFNTCTTVAPGQSYLLWTTAAGALAVTGDRVPMDTPVQLHAGYNWLGYLPTCELTVATALAGIAGKYTIVHSEVGTYRPPPANPAFNNFNTLAPGRGYMIYMTETATLVYPANLCGTGLQGAEPTEGPAAACPAQPTSRFTHFYGQLAAPAGAEVLAYSPRGEVVGCGRVGEEGLLPYLRVYGAEGDIPGMLPGEPIRFTVSGQDLDVRATWRNDWGVHRLGEDATPTPLFLPLIVR